MIKRIFFSERYLSKGAKKGYEGWYFKTEINERAFAFIAGICHNANDRHSFIQYIDEVCSLYFRFDYNDFRFKKEDMRIEVAGNVFSLNGIEVDLSGNGNQIKCGVKYLNIIKYKKSPYAPSVMGPFSYVSILTNHCVAMLYAKAEGFININGLSYSGTGSAYIEKDYGTRFPDNYIWVQGQGECEGQPVSLVFALAYPLPALKRGYLCLLYFKGKQYNFSLYHCARLSIKEENDSLCFTVKKGKSQISVKVEYNNISNKKLYAPDPQGMKTAVYENLSAQMQITLNINKKQHQIPLPAAVEIYHC